jgi:hypothetical protein
MSLSITGNVNKAASIPAIVSDIEPKSTLKYFCLFKQFKLSKAFNGEWNQHLNQAGMRAFNK